MIEISPLQYITHPNARYTYVEQAEAACQAGFGWIQFRMKDGNLQDKRVCALEVRQVCVQYKAKFIINDHVELARELFADGVHLGQSDCSPELARRELGPHAIIGGTANTFEQVQSLANLQIDYLGIGPFKSTHTKSSLSPLLGLSGCQDISKKCATAGIRPKLIAVGGITLGDLENLLASGFHGIALSSALHNTPNMFEAAKRFADRYQELTSREALAEPRKKS